MQVVANRLAYEFELFSVQIAHKCVSHLFESETVECDERYDKPSLILVLDFSKNQPSMMCKYQYAPLIWLNAVECRYLADIL